MNRKPRKQVLYPAGMVNDQVHNDADCPVNIREIPVCRIIDFYGTRLTFIPYGGSLWMPIYDLIEVLDLHPDQSVVDKEKYHHIARQSKSLYLGDIVGCDVDNRLCISICYARMVATETRISSFLQMNSILMFSTGRLEAEKKYSRITPLEELLTELQLQHGKVTPIHSHNIPSESERLHEVLDKHPHWVMC